MLGKAGRIIYPSRFFNEFWRCFVKKRVVSFILALTLFMFTPVSDYFGARDVYAMNAVTASEYVWSILFSTVGRDISRGNLPYVVGDIGKYVQVDDRYMKLYRAVANASYGSVIKLGEGAVKLVRDYFSSKDISGGKFNVPVSISHWPYESSFASHLGYDNTRLSSLTRKKITTKGYIFSWKSSRNDYYYDYFISDFHFNKGLVSACCYTMPLPSSSKVMSYHLAYLYSDGSVYDDGRFATVYFSRLASSASKGYDVSESISTKDGISVSDIPLPVFSGKEEALAFLHTGDNSGQLNDVKSSYQSVTVPLYTVSDISDRVVTTDGTITIPDKSVAVNVLDDIANATTPADRAVALAPTMDVIYGDKVDEDDDAGTYPWLPDITNVLNGIRDRVAGVSDGVGSLSDAIASGLAGLGEKVDAIPNTIAKDISTTDVSKVNSFAISDLSNIFPFCLPFDLIDLFSVLSAEPQAPRFVWTFPAVPDYGIPKVDVVIDLSDFDPVAKIVRTMETLLFIVGLVMITRSHMIRG